MRQAVCLLALILAVPVAAEPFHHPFGELREYNRDWLAVCPDHIRDDDDTGYYATSCFASTGAGGTNATGEPNYKLTLIRNRLTGRLALAFTAAPTDGTKLDTSRPLVIVFGGTAPLAFAFGTDLEMRYGTINQFFVSSEDKFEILLQAMRERNTAQVRIPVLDGDADELAIQFSMQGVLASIDFMQTYARRVETYD